MEESWNHSHLLEKPFISQDWVCLSIPVAWVIHREQPGEQPREQGRAAEVVMGAEHIVGVLGQLVLCRQRSARSILMAAAIKGSTWIKHETV